MICFVLGVCWIPFMLHSCFSGHDIGSEVRFFDHRGVYARLREACHRLLLFLATDALPHDDDLLKTRTGPTHLSNPNSAIGRGVAQLSMQRAPTGPSASPYGGAFSLVFSVIRSRVMMCHSATRECHLSRLTGCTVGMRLYTPSPASVTSSVAGWGWASCVSRLPYAAPPHLFPSPSHPLGTSKGQQTVRDTGNGSPWLARDSRRLPVLDAQSARSRWSEVPWGPPAGISTDHLLFGEAHLLPSNPSSDTKGPGAYMYWSRLASETSCHRRTTTPASAPLRPCVVRGSPIVP